MFDSSSPQPCSLVCIQLSQGSKPELHQRLINIPANVSAFQAEKIGAAPIWDSNFNALVAG